MKVCEEEKVRKTLESRRRDKENANRKCVKKRKIIDKQ